MELTKEGQQRNNQGSSGGGGWFNPGGQQSNSYSYNKNWDKNSTSGIGDLIVLGVICLVVYAMYKTCIENGGKNIFYVQVCFFVIVHNFCFILKANCFQK